MNKLTFYIVRHGKTMMNTLRRVQGWCDSPLTSAGVEVARYLGYGFDEAGINFRSAYCSDLSRTRQTAQIVLASKGQDDISITEYVGLREACFGSYECGLDENMWLHVALHLQYTSLEEMSEAILKKEMTYGQILDTVKKLDKMSMAECFAEVEARTQESLTEIAERELQQGDGNVLVIAHGMSILCMLHNLGGNKLLDGPLDNASVCKIIYSDGKFAVESMGDMSYVELGKKHKI